MKAIPLTLLKNFEKYLISKEIPTKFQGEYKKWLNSTWIFVEAISKRPLRPISALDLGGQSSK